MLLLLLASALSGCLDEEATQPNADPRSAHPHAKQPGGNAEAEWPTYTHRQRTAKADWTVLVYLDGDNNLEE